MALILYKTFSLMEYCPFGGVLSPLLGFNKELKFKEKKDFQENVWSSLLLKIIFFINKFACQNARNGISDLLDFEIFRPPRGSCLWNSLLPPPTFIFKPSTPKIIENPDNLSLAIQLDLLKMYIWAL